MRVTPERRNINLMYSDGMYSNGIYSDGMYSDGMYSDESEPQRKKYKSQCIPIRVTRKGIK